MNAKILVITFNHKHWRWYWYWLPNDLLELPRHNSPFCSKAKIVFLIVLHKICTGLDLDKEKTILKLKKLELEQVPKIRVSYPCKMVWKNGFISILIRIFFSFLPSLFNDFSNCTLKLSLKYSKICMKRGRVRISFNQFLHGIPNSEHVIKK